MFSLASLSHFLKSELADFLKPEKELLLKSLLSHYCAIYNVGAE